MGCLRDLRDLQHVGWRCWQPGRWLQLAGCLDAGRPRTGRSAPDARPWPNLSPSLPPGPWLAATRLPRQRTGPQRDCLYFVINSYYPCPLFPRTSQEAREYREVGLAPAGPEALAARPPGEAICGYPQYRSLTLRWLAGRPAGCRSAGGWPLSGCWLWRRRWAAMRPLLPQAWWPQSRGAKWPRGGARRWPGPALTWRRASTGRFWPAGKR